jgi:hypothetical protein
VFLLDVTAGTVPASHLLIRTASDQIDMEHLQATKIPRLWIIVLVDPLEDVTESEGLGVHGMRPSASSWRFVPRAMTPRAFMRTVAEIDRSSLPTAHGDIAFGRGARLASAPRRS